MGESALWARPAAALRLHSNVPANRLNSVHGGRQRKQTSTESGPLSVRYSALPTTGAPATTRRLCLLFVCASPPVAYSGGRPCARGCSWGKSGLSLGSRRWRWVLRRRAAGPRGVQNRRALRAQPVRPGGSGCWGPLDVQPVPPYCNGQRADASGVEVSVGIPGSSGSETVSTWAIA